MGSIEDDLWRLTIGADTWTGNILTDRVMRRLVYNPIDRAMEQVLDRIEIRIDVDSMGYAKCSQMKAEL